MPATIPFLMAIDETFDVGSDLRTGVNDADYAVPFTFTGTINKVTVKLGPPQLSAGAAAAAEVAPGQRRRLASTRACKRTGDLGAVALRSPVFISCRCPAAPP